MKDKITEYSFDYEKEKYMLSNEAIAKLEHEDECSVFLRPDIIKFNNKFRLALIIDIWTTDKISEFRGDSLIDKMNNFFGSDTFGKFLQKNISHLSTNHIVVTTFSGKDEERYLWSPETRPQLIPWVMGEVLTN